MTEQEVGRFTGSREPSPCSTGLGPSGFDPERIQPYAPFSVRDHLGKAIADPGSVTDRWRSEDNMLEALSHWQARATLEVIEREAERSPMFRRWLQAIAIEARQGIDAKRLDGEAAKGEARQ